MSVSAAEQSMILHLPAHPAPQLDERVRLGYASDRQDAAIVAVEQLYTAAVSRSHMPQQAFARLYGALSLGTTRQSLCQADLDRLAWERGER